MRGSVCAWVGVACVSSAAAFAEPIGAPLRDLPPISLREMAPFPGPETLGTQQFSSSGPLECRAWWDNGAFDIVGALNSQELYDANQNLIFRALVADDFFLKFGHCYVIESVEVYFAIFGTPGTPNVELRIYDDCNGKPAAEAYGPFGEATYENFGPITAWPGFNLYRVRWTLNRFEHGFRRLWIVPVGQGQGLYYWLTANNGGIQGVQGQYLSPQYGYPEWTDVDDVGDCPTDTCSLPCTDFTFRICGKVCWLLKDQSDFDLAGLSSIAFANNLLFGNRAVDNFQVPPGDVIELCRVEAWMATNCDPARAFMEIYENLCDAPAGAPIVLEDPEFELLCEAGAQSGDDCAPLLYDGLPVYRFSFTCPEVYLQPGRNYWLSLSALGVGSPHERAIWLFRQQSDCHICITEGRWRSLYLGFPDFTPVSHPGLAGAAREFALRIHGAKPGFSVAADEG